MIDKFELSALIGRLAEARVVAVGDLMLDRFIEGVVDRISPEAPIPVFSMRRESSMLGGVGNVLRNLSALGADSELIAVVGDDAAGDEVATLVAEEARVRSHLIRVAGRQTTIKTRFVAGTQQILRTDRETMAPLSEKDQAMVLESTLSALDGGGVLVLSDYGKGILPDATIARLIEGARAAGWPVVVDPKGIDYGRYRGARVVTPNRQELALASGMPTEGDEEVVAACRHIIETAGVEAVLATRSEQGMTLVDRDATHHLPARAREVFDVSGAGDTVAAALAVGLAVDSPMLTAARLANAAAGVVVAKVGTAVARPSEVLISLHEGELMDAEAKVATLPGARERVNAWRRQDMRIGFTNGCFDLLHPGHVSLMNQAKAACDRLVVGLNSDDSARRLKGEGRPVQSEAGRAAVLASLAVIDMVVIFADDTPIELIKTLKPDVLVKGADYSLAEVVGAKEVESWGGQVVLAELLEGHSTTETIARMAT